MWDQTFHAARVRMTVGGRVAVQLAAVALPWTSLVGLYSDTERPHTMFRLLNIFLASSVLGRTARTSHNGEPSLAKSVHRVHREALAAEVGLDFVYREVGRNAADNGFSLRSSSRAYV
ncbi:hypothetical protein EVAR_75034_1 [Eumeta japonica]|uniref:Uncharacterized protein n=1 Tax=Eumeta variegata TaxID=151549 RepID=A0A4C1W384_EUMVA|nr:hypothetical protein EVAR_75034_1 [Eumeta japonica]